MSANDTSRIVIDDSRVTLQIVASLTGDSRGIIYDRNVFIELANSVSLGIFNSPRTDSGNAYDDVKMNADNNKIFIMVFLKLKDLIFQVFFVLNSCIKDRAFCSTGYLRLG